VGRAHRTGASHLPKAGDGDANVPTHENYTVAPAYSRLLLLAATNLL
jgi:hypothetical protein